MRHEQVPAEVVELARQHGIDVEQVAAAELSDADLEALAGGQKQGGFKSANGVTSGWFRKN
jgi:hypothetical protein